MNQDDVPFSERELIKKLWTFIYPSRYLLLLAIILLFASRAIEAFVPIYVGFVVQKMMTSLSLSHEAQETLLHQIIRGTLETIGFLILSFFLYLIMLYIKGQIGQKAVYKLRTQVYSHILKLPVSYYDQHAIGQLMTRTIHDVDQIDQMFTESIVPILGNSFLFLCIAIGIFFINWHLGIFFCFIMPLLGWMTYKFHFAQRNNYDKQRTVLSHLNVFIQEHLVGASTVRTFGLQRQEKAKFEEINKTYGKINLDVVQSFVLFIAGLDFFQTISLIFVFVILMLFATPNDSFQVGTFFTLNLYATMLFRPLVDLAERYNVLQSAMAASSKVFSLLENPIEKDDKKIYKVENLDKIESIEFDNVWFAYKDNHWILKGLTFQLKQGESVAIVGVTGSGKTTIIQLLLRFYEFQKGSIKINGIDIRHISREKVRALFSIVLQDPMIFSGTIRDNITLYQDIPDGVVNEAIDLANFRSYVSGHKDGLKHLLTERGQSLSVGEMQLLSLARAVAQNRPVLILDEATANIDSESEQKIQNALEKILFHKTAFVIAHRLSTIKDVDKILVLNNGVVAESGSHEELIKQKGLYENLYKLQVF